MDKVKPYLAAILLVTCSLFGWTKEDFSHGKDWAYQDLWINEKILFKGCGPDCSSRYDAIKPILDQFDRPFSVLEIGANNGYFSLRIANDYDATCVMIDGTDRLKQICEANSSLNRIIYLQKMVTPKDLLKIAKKEHFDVILCFHVLHHVDWKPFFSSLLTLGDHVIIETPPIDDGFVSEKPQIPEIAEYLLSLPSGVPIGSFQRQNPEIKDHMILFSNPKKSNSWKKTAFMPGISLKTFYKFGGAYPNIPKRNNPNNWYTAGNGLIFKTLTQRH